MDKIIKRILSIILGFGFYVLLFWLLPNYYSTWRELLRGLTIIETIIALHIIMIVLVGYLFILALSIIDGWFQFEGERQ